MRVSIHFEQLLFILDDLDRMFIAGRMSWHEYHSEWMGVLTASGYTIDEYIAALDKRWDEETKVVRHIAMA